MSSLISLAINLAIYFCAFYALSRWMTYVQRKRFRRDFDEHTQELEAEYVRVFGDVEKRTLGRGRHIHMSGCGAQLPNGDSIELEAFSVTDQEPQQYRFRVCVQIGGSGYIAYVVGTDYIEIHDAIAARDDAVRRFAVYSAMMAIKIA